MPAIAPALVAQIAATAAIVDLIGTRVYPVYTKLADKTYPLIVYKADNGSSTPSYDGTVNQTRSTDIVLACVGSTYAQADGLKDAVLTAFDGFPGPGVTNTWGTSPAVTVLGCFLHDDGVSDDVVTDQETEEILYYVREVTFLVWYVQ